MNCLLKLLNKKQLFLNTYFDWLIINSYFTILQWFFVNYFNTFFFNLYFFIRNCKKNEILLDKNVGVKNYNIKVVKKKLFYYYFLTQSNTPMHWIYSKFSIHKNFGSNSLFDNYFFFRELKNFINMFYNLIKYDFLFLFLSFDFLKYEVSSFIKYLFGVNVYVEYPFLFDFLKLNLRSNAVKYYFIDFLKVKNIKLLIFLNYTHSLYYINFIKQINIVTFGLLPINSSFEVFDYWLITKSNDFVSNYLLFSLIFSIYNKVLFEQQLYLFSSYNYTFFNLLRV